MVTPAATPAPTAGDAPSRSLVIPVYLNEPNIPRLLEVVEKLTDDLVGDLEVVFVVDGSPDDSLALLTRSLPETRIRAQVLVHARNFGSFPAIRTGLAAARGEHIAVMAADLQEPIELVEQFFEILHSGDADVVVGARESRADGAMRDIMSNAYWRLARRVISNELPEGGVDVFAINAMVRDALLELREQRSSLVGQLYWLGFRRREVFYARQEREEGESGWTMRKKINYLLDSFFSFTDVPIRVLTLVGMFGFALAALLSASIVIARSFGWIDVPGYAATVLVVLIFSTLNLLSLGLVGNYVYRTYENSKERPLSLVAGHFMFSGGQPATAAPADAATRAADAAALLAHPAPDNLREPS